MNRACRAALLTFALLAACLPARAQDSTGTVDTRGDIAARIRELEQQVGGDESAEQQSVVLLWLADLYVAAGRLDSAAAAYEQVLTFFPFDPAATNAYARFLLDQRGDPEHAEKILHDALANANAMASPPPYIGQTYALRARALREMGRCDDAMEPSDNALALLDADAIEDALRVRAVCLAETGKRDQARQAFLELIGASNGSNPDDISSYIALLTATSGHVDAARVKKDIAQAIEEAREARRADAAAEGAEIVELRSSDGARIETTLRKGGGARAVVFVPETGERRATYKPYAQLLALDGITTLTVDPRGYGDSRCDSLPDAPLLTGDQRARIADDIAAAVRYLRDDRGFRIAGIAVVSAGDGAGYVERARHENALPVAAIHLSPVFDPEDRAVSAALSFRPPRAALLFASGEDVYAVRSLGYFRASTDADSVTARVFRSAGHGVSIIRDPARYRMMADWIEQRLPAGR